MSKELGGKLVDLISEAMTLKDRVNKADIQGYRNPLWYDECRERIDEIETELGGLLTPVTNQSPFYSQW